MEKSVKDRIPAVLMLLMGLVGMTTMTLTCYLWGEEPFDPQDIAIKAAWAWGIMMAVGYVVGMFAKTFIPEPAVRKGTAGIAPAQKDGAEGADKKDGDQSSTGSGLDDNTLDILLNETPAEQLAAGANSASVSAPR